MKKTLIIISLILLIAFTPTQEKKYKFEFNDQELNLLWNTIDNSNAPHQQVKEIQQIIQNQLKGQVISDSTKLKK